MAELEMRESMREKFERLVHPTPMFNVYEQTPQKNMAVARYLMEGYLNLSDEHRNYDLIYEMLNRYVNGGALMYEIGELNGLMGFIDIVPMYKAGVFLKIFDNSVWGKTVVREGLQVLDIVSNAFEFKRLSTKSADPRVVKMCEKLFGFKREGMRPLDFSWDGKLYDNYLLGRIRKEE